LLLDVARPAFSFRRFFIPRAPCSTRRFRRRALRQFFSSQQQTNVPSFVPSPLSFSSSPLLFLTLSPSFSPPVYSLPSTPSKPLGGHHPSKKAESAQNPSRAPSQRQSKAEESTGNLNWGKPPWFNNPPQTRTIGCEGGGRGVRMIGEIHRPRNRGCPEASPSWPARPAYRSGPAVPTQLGDRRWVPMIETGKYKPVPAGASVIVSAQRSFGT